LSALFLILFIFKDKIFNSDWAGEIYDPPTNTVINKEKKRVSSTSFNEEKLRNEQQSIVNLAEMGYAQRAQKRQKISKFLYQNDTDFQYFSLELERKIGSLFDKSFSKAQRFLEEQNFERARAIIKNLQSNHPQHPKSKDLENMILSIPFLQARAKQKETKQDHFQNIDYPVLNELKEKSKNYLINPTDSLRKVHDYAKSEEEKSEDKNLRYILRSEQIWAKAEYQLFYDLIKVKNLVAASTFLERNYNTIKTVSDINALGFTLNDGSQISFSYFKVHQYPDLFVSSIPASAKRSRNLAIYSFKHNLKDYYQTFSEELKNPKELKLLDFIQGSAKVRETLLKKHSEE